MNQPVEWKVRVYFVFVAHQHSPHSPGVLFTAQVILGASLLLITSPSTSETSARCDFFVESDDSNHHHPCTFGVGYLDVPGS